MGGGQGAGGETGSGGCREQGLLIGFSNADLTSGVEFYGLPHSVNMEPQSLEIFCRFRRIMACLTQHTLHRQGPH